MPKSNGEQKLKVVHDLTTELLDRRVLIKGHITADSTRAEMTVCEVGVLYPRAEDEYIEDVKKGDDK